MQIQTRSIVLHSVPFGETGLIVQLFTAEKGRISCMIKGVKSKKSRFKPAYFRVGSLLDIHFTYKQNKDLQHIKDISIVDPLHGIQSDIMKSTILSFLGEILSKILIIEEQSEELYDFIEQAFLLFDRQEEHISDFHIWFLLQLSRHMGVFPDNNFADSSKFFDVSAGRFTGAETGFTLSLAQSELLHSVLRDSDTAALRITATQRKQMLDILIDYYSYHMNSLGKIKSLKVLREVFG